MMGGLILPAPGIKRSENPGMSRVKRLTEVSTVKDQCEFFLYFAQICLSGNPPLPGDDDFTWENFPNDGKNKFSKYV